MTEFFMPMIPPTVTHQEKQVAIRNGKPVFYEPPELKDARAKLMSHLAGHQPDKPLNCGVRLTVKWLFYDHTGKLHKDGEYRITKPDTDNLIKLLKDCMTALCFWKDDAQVASEHNEKFWVVESPSGIYVKIEELP